MQATVVSGPRPILLLLMFTTLNFFIYFDRGVYGAVLNDIQTKFHLSSFNAGICSSSYLVCFCAASPVIAQAAKYSPPFRMCGVGMLIWVAAVIGTGLSQEFWTLLLSRSFTGFGEASFLVMAAPLIDFFAPPRNRTTWLASFYAAIPLGYAGGAVVGGALADSDLFGSYWSWRSVYFLEAIASMPPILAFIFTPGPSSLLEISNRTSTTNSVIVLQHDDAKGEAIVIESLTTTRPRQDSTRERLLVVGKDLKDLLFNRLYVLITLGYATQTFFAGAVAVFGMDYLEHQYGFSKTDAGVLFGTITALTGLIGSGLGGFIVDRIKPKSSDTHYSEIEIAAHKVVLVCSVIAAPASMMGFVTTNIWVFVPLLVIAEMAAFMMIGPINSSIVWCVPIPLQPTAVAVATLTIHLLGDALSPVLIGELIDRIGRRTAMFVSASWMLLPIVFFGMGLIVCYRMQRNYRRERSSLISNQN